MKVYIVFKQECVPIIDSVWENKQDTEKRKEGIIKRRMMDGYDRSNNYSSVESWDVL